MYIAQELRKKSIAEYLLYMWQVEDLIRAYDCNLARMRREYLSKFDCSEEMKEDLVDWYANLIRMLTQEGCREKGHLQINKIIASDMNVCTTNCSIVPSSPSTGRNTTKCCRSSSNSANVAATTRRTR